MSAFAPRIGRSKPDRATGRADRLSRRQLPARPRPVGASADPAEREADEVAGQIMTGGLSAVPFDFSRIRVYRDDAAADAMGAVAYTVGRDVVLGRRVPAGLPGNLVLAHEFGHVVAEARRPGPPVIRRLVKPEDVSIELHGRPFTIAEPVTTPHGVAPAGTVVTIVDWINSMPTARVQFAATAAAPAFDLDVSKIVLRPVHPNVYGMVPYSAGIDRQARDTERGEAALAAELSRPEGTRPDEVTRITDEQRNRVRRLNRLIIQETMINRFDGLIKYWVDHYNAEFDYLDTDPLDPNLVKSMIYEESKMGTGGEHLDPVPASPVSRKSRFNIGQVVDSGGPALLIMMHEMAPALILTHHLENIRADLIVAQRRHKQLTEMATRTPAEDAELMVLNRQSEPDSAWEQYFWEYPSLATLNFALAVQEFFTPAPGGTSRQLSYDFWIQTAVRWLFEKRKRARSWAEAVYLYNGDKELAGPYRDRVVGRASAAAAAGRDQETFTPIDFR